MLVSDENASLPGFEAEAAAKLHQELLDVGEERLFEVRLVHHVARFEAKKLEHMWVTDDQGRCGALDASLHDRNQLGFVL